MSVGLKYLYQEIKKFDVNIVAGKKGLKNQVKWTHMAENEEILEYIHGQELIFTTGLVLKNQDDLYGLVKRANEKGSSGLILFIGKYIDYISDSIIAYCNEHDFPLFTVPWGVEMSDTMRSLMVQIIESEKTYKEIANALKDSIFIPDHSELYMPILNKIGFKNEWKYMISLIELESKNINEYRVEEHTSEMINLIEEELSYLRNNFFCLSAGQSLIIIFYNKTFEEVNNLSKDIYIKLVKHFDKANFYIGVEKQSCSLDRLHRVYKEVKKIVKINRLLRNNDVHLGHNEVGIYKFFLDIYDKDKMKAFYDDTLGKLELYDKVNNSDYVKVLISYYENNCKCIETAKSLYIHRNTMTYKINRIQEILGVDLSEVGDRSKIYVALMIKYLL